LNEGYSNPLVSSTQQISLHSIKEAWKDVGSLKPQSDSKLSFDHFKEVGLVTESGKIRLNLAQDYFAVNQNYFPLLPQLYEAWRDTSEYMIYHHLVDGEIELGEDGQPLNFAFKCSKRGNDVYVSRVKKRFKRFRDSISEKRFFSVSDFKVGSVVKTSLLWITLTYDTHRCSIKQAWKNIGVEYNRWISALRRRYGKISALRSWETYENGYPHVHTVLHFEKAQFTVFEHFNVNKGKMSFRIQEKHEFEPYWHEGHSFTDVEALSSMKKMVYYVTKYQLKVNESQEEVSEGSSDSGQRSKTLAFMWLFRKRSYSMSGDFIELFSRLDSSLHNSNMDFELDPFESTESWRFLGVVLGRDIGLNGEWLATVKWDRLVKLLFPMERRDESRYPCKLEVDPLASRESAFD
jgi:hypothetical protein